MPTPKKKTAKRKSSSRNSIPSLSHPEIVADQRYPIATDAVPAMADKLVKLWADIDQWKQQCRKAFADGKTVKELAPFPRSKIPIPT